jgi:hypothetical protein
LPREDRRCSECKPEQAGSLEVDYADDIIISKTGKEGGDLAAIASDEPDSKHTDAAVDAQHRAESQPPSGERAAPTGEAGLDG